MNYIGLHNADIRGIDQTLFPVHQKAGFDKLINWSKIPSMPEVEEQWYDYEFKNDNASFVYLQRRKSKKKYDCFSCGKSDLQYLRAYVKKIMRYNNSSNYAVGV